MKKVKNEDIIIYKDWKDLKSDMEFNGEIRRIVKIIENNIHDKVLRLLKNHKNSDTPAVILTTAHKSKGREFDQVVLGNDFPELFDRDVNEVELPTQEINLIYVASTRAKRVLEVNTTVSQMMDRVGWDGDYGLSYEDGKQLDLDMMDPLTQRALGKAGSVEEAFAVVMHSRINELRRDMP